MGLDYSATHCTNTSAARHPHSPSPIPRPRHPEFAAGSLPRRRPPRPPRSFRGFPVLRHALFPRETEGLSENAAIQGPGLLPVELVFTSCVDLLPFCVASRAWGHALRMRNGCNFPSVVSAVSSRDGSSANSMRSHWGRLRPMWSARRIWPAISCRKFAMGERREREEERRPGIDPGTPRRGSRGRSAPQRQREPAPPQRCPLPAR